MDFTTREEEFDFYRDFRVKSSDFTTKWVTFCGARGLPDNGRRQRRLVWSDRQGQGNEPRHDRFRDFNLTLRRYLVVYFLPPGARPLPGLQGRDGLVLNGRGEGR